MLLIGLFLEIFGLAALATYDFENSVNDKSATFGGEYGAIFAEYMYGALGYLSWSLLGCLVWLLAALTGRATWSNHRLMAGFGMVVPLSGLAAFVGETDAGMAFGGDIGSRVLGWMSNSLGVWGAGLSLVACTALLATVAFRLNWMEIFGAAEGRVKKIAPPAQQGLKRIGTAGAGVTMRLFKWIWGGVVALSSAIGAALSRTAQGVWASFRRGEESWNRNVRPFRGEIALDSPTGDTDVGHTHIGPKKMGLGEVEWGGTQKSVSGETPLPTVPRHPASDDDDPDTEIRDLSSSLGLTHEPEEPFPTTPLGIDVPVPSGPIPQNTETPRPAVAREDQVSSGSSDAVVHDAEHLNDKVSDDGGALVERTTFRLPKLSLLDKVPVQTAVFDDLELRKIALTIEEKLQHFKVKGRVTDVRPGPVVTIFEFLPEPGVKVSKIAGFADDLAMALHSMSVRIVAPIPGKGVVGIEIPSRSRLTIFFRDVLASDEFRDTDATLPVVLGKDVAGVPVVADLAAMPHVLVGGTTGSGKSVGVNGMLISLLFKLPPDELKLLLIDPKMLEFGLYDDIPHLIHPVVTEPKGAAHALSWACVEMDRRYGLMKKWKTRNLANYNAKSEILRNTWSRRVAKDFMDDDELFEDFAPPEKLPFIVIVIDELADLMMVARADVETSIARLAQKARACGMHLIVATQRPSVDVVTGVIKANLPTRIAFQLRTATDSRTVLGAKGANKLLGKGDLLFLPPGTGNLQRCHGAFVSDEEVQRVMTFLTKQGKPNYIAGVCDPVDSFEAEDPNDRDPLYEEAVEIVVNAGKASTSLVQRHLRIGYNRAARIIDSMERAGVVGPSDGAKGREVLVDGL
jgi:hypothetical protein